jgi:hypothetical protein
MAAVDRKLGLRTVAYSLPAARLLIITYAVTSLSTEMYSYKLIASECRKKGIVWPGNARTEKYYFW